MARPKSSIVGFVDLGVSATNAVGLKSMKRRLGDISSELSNETKQINKELTSLRNAQLATVTGMIEIHNRLETIEQQSSEVLKEMKRQDAEAEILGNLKILLIAFEDEMRKIEELAEEYPAYAAMLAEDLSNYLHNNSIDYTKFKRMDFDGIQKAKQVIEQIHEFKQKMISNLE